jgi:hypothetical protein
MYCAQGSYAVACEERSSLLHVCNLYKCVRCTDRLSGSSWVFVNWERHWQYARPTPQGVHVRLSPRACAPRGARQQTGVRDLVCKLCGNVLLCLTFLLS